MSSKSAETEESLADGITSAEIKAAIAERKTKGATSCKVVTKNGKKFLVCKWPPL